ncbi:class I adenylate-forming enzyme family protein [Stutzerimonas tarimensis]|uniref:Class I adenylate-forming enzyme family protein n=1 Tax=Stutzerimonas tarimensis TaxID=1507735 RepID=A0ABV7T804_9GAMM
MNDLIHALPAQAALESNAPFVDLHSQLSAVCTADADRIAVIDEDGAWTRRELLALANRVANRLVAAGLDKGATVAMLGRNSRPYVAVMVGVLAAGGCIVPLSGMASTETLALMVEDCGALFCFAEPNGRDLLDAALGSTGNKELHRILLEGDAPGWHGLPTWLGDTPDSPPGVRIEPDDLFNIIYSSGTTGIPKGIVQDHQTRFRNMERYRTLGFSGEAVTLVATPLYSNTTMVAVLPTLAFGGLLVMLGKFDAGRYLELAERHRVTHTMLVPIQYQRLLDEPGFDRRDLSSFQIKLSAGAPLRAKVIAELMARWPGRLLEVYGMTEGGVSATLDCVAYPDKWDSVGRPSAGCSLLLIDESGKPVRQGEVGEVVGRSTGMMRGYHNRPEASEALLWRDEDGTVYFRSGDIGRFDEDGFLYLLDRRKDMILSGGFNVYAEDLERVLLEHPQVVDAAVIAVPSERWGETPLGLVITAAGEAVTCEELLAWANHRLGKTQRLSRVEIRTELSRNPAGKLLKAQLRAPYWVDAERARPT